MASGPPTSPCIDCGDERPVSAKSRTNVLCRPCRKIRRDAMGGDVEFARARSREYARKRRAARKALQEPATCVVCGAPAVKTRCAEHKDWKHTRCSTCDTPMYSANAAKPGRRNVYCSADCKPVRLVIPVPDRNAIDRGHHRARARRFGVAYEPIQPRRVYARDGWRCGICGERVNQRLAWPNQMCASLDHIVPMSQGGDHLYVNVQCAHWLCNTLKAARGGGEQLALIG